MNPDSVVLVFLFIGLSVRIWPMMRRRRSVQKGTVLPNQRAELPSERVVRLFMKKR